MSTAPEPPFAERISMDEFEKLGHAVVTELARFLRSSSAGEVPVVPFDGIDEVARKLSLEERLRNGRMGVADLVDFAHDYCAMSAGHHHPGYLAHQIAPPDLPSVIGDLIKGVTNNIPLIYELAPAGTAVDRTVYSWMLRQAGWADSGTGTLTSGGTLGNLTALLAARAHAAPLSRRDGNPGGLVVLAPPSSHYSLRKAVMVLGLGESALVGLPVDRYGRIDVEQLPGCVERLSARGLRPMALVANACATATGLHDDLVEIGQFCAGQDIWLHVDGAHGASGLLSPRLRSRFEGLSHASSLIWDAHKMLRASALCTGVLFRKAQDFEGLFRQDASYLFHEEALAADMGQRTFETSKPPLGLNTFLNLAAQGEHALRGYVEDQYDKATRFWELIGQRPDFEAPYRPESNILCFRYRGLPDGQLWIRDQLREAGNFYLSSAEVDGRTHLRVAIMSPTTDETALHRLLDDIERIGCTAGPNRTFDPGTTLSPRTETNR